MPISTSKSDGPVPPPEAKPKERRKASDEEDKQYKVPAIGDTQKGLHAVFNMASRLAGSDARFEEREFEDEARGLTAFGRRIKYLALILPWLGPLVVALSMADKINRIREGRRARAERKRQEQAQGETTLGWVAAHVQPPQPGDMHQSTERVTSPSPSVPDGSEESGPPSPSSEPSPYQPSSAGHRPGLSRIFSAGRAVPGV